MIGPSPTSPRMMSCLIRVAVSGFVWSLLFLSGWVSPVAAATVQSDFRDLVRDLGMATSAVPYRDSSAADAPWSLGVSGSAIRVPDRGYVDRLYPNEEPPDYFYLPRVHLGRRIGRSGFFTGFYSENPENDLRVLGGSVGVSVEGWEPSLPRFTLRAIGSRVRGERGYVIQGVTVENLEIQAVGGEGIVAWPLGSLTPYAGYGRVDVEGDAAAQSNLVTLERVETTEGRALVGFVVPARPLSLSAQFDHGSVNLLTVALFLNF